MTKFLVNETKTAPFNCLLRDSLSYVDYDPVSHHHDRSRRRFIERLLVNSQDCGKPREPGSENEQE